MLSSAIQSANPDVLHPDPLHRVELALEDLREGRMVILVDDEDRENEGDIVLAADRVTPEAINFMATHARGLICLSLTGEQVDRLGLTMMATHNQSPYNTAFTVSIEAREGVTTGISAADRARTIQVAIGPEATRRDIVTPGHIFPLRARPGGVLERVGQTEGSVDLARLAGLAPAGVICEIMNEDGTMARMPELLAFGEQHSIRVVAVADIIKYRMRTERVVVPGDAGQLEVPGLGTWTTRIYRGIDGHLHMALTLGTPGPSRSLVRVQAAPPPWAVFAPDSSKLARSARTALERVHQAGEGAVILMHLQGGGMEGLEASFRSDFLEPQAAPSTRAQALRDLGTGCQILVDLGLRDLALLTNSPRPIVGVEAYGLTITERLPL